MKRLIPSSLFLLGAAAVALAPSPEPLHAGPSGYSSYSGGAVYRGCRRGADSKFSTPRYNQLLPFRHYEDRRRYNAAPCKGEIVYVKPYLIKTVVVRKQRVAADCHRSGGLRRHRSVLLVTYKSLYSDGSCYVWTERG